MSKKSDSSALSRREFLVRAGSVATTGCLVIKASSSIAAGAPARRTATPNYVVTIDITKCPAITYTTDQGSDAYVLQVNPKEVVIWKAKTNGSEHHLAILFIGDTPFVDKNGKKVYAFHGAKADEATGKGIGINASIDPNASEDEAYEYYVAVWDESYSTTCTDDPTIMIGKRDSQGAGSARAKLSAAKRLLGKAAVAFPKEKEAIEQIESQTQALLDKLLKE